MTKPWKPKPGDKCRLIAYDRVPLDSEKAADAAKKLTVTYVENVGTAAEPIWVIEVDSPDINRYMLESSMFERIQS